MFGIPLTPDEVVRRGEALYQRMIIPEIEARHTGEYIVFNVLTGEYEMAPDDLDASMRAKKRFKDAPLFTMRIGHSATYRIGGSSLVGLQ